MDVPDATRLKSLEAQITPLKKLLAETILENEGRQDALRNGGSRTVSSGAGAVVADEVPLYGALRGQIVSLPQRHRRYGAA
jgi:hypothetical protein